MTSFRAFRVERTDGRKFERRIVERDTADLPPGDLLIDVEYSSLNYKDALSSIGNPGVTRTYPHTPGIDAAGTVIESSSNLFAPGDAAIVCGYDLGMNTPGGFGQRIRVPVGWALPVPEGLDARSSMILGTAGFTAALAVDRLEAAGMGPDDGPVLVTGATGGVGSVAVALLARLGYKVHAASGKVSSYQFLIDLGATDVIWRDELLRGSDRPLLKAVWGGAIDTVGGPILFNAVKSLRYGASLAACGLVASPKFSATVFPFILRGVNLLGIDSVELPLERKADIWRKLAGPWKLDRLDTLAFPLTLDNLSVAIDRILAGEVVGRGLVDLRA